MGKSADDDLKQLIPKIEAAMADRGLNQAKLAKAMGQHQPKLSRYMSGDSKPTLVDFAEMCRVLAVPPWYFTDEKTPVRPVPRLDQPGEILTEMEMRFLRAVRAHGADHIVDGIIGRLFAQAGLGEAVVRPTGPTYGEIKAAEAAPPKAGSNDRRKPGAGTG